MQILQQQERQQQQITTAAANANQLSNQSKVLQRALPRAVSATKVASTNDESPARDESTKCNKSANETTKPQSDRATPCHTETTVHATSATTTSALSPDTTSSNIQQQKIVNVQRSPKIDESKIAEIKRELKSPPTNSRILSPPCGPKSCFNTTTMFHTTISHSSNSLNSTSNIVFNNSDLPNSNRECGPLSYDARTRHSISLTNQSKDKKKKPKTKPQRTLPLRLLAPPSCALLPAPDHCQVSNKSPCRDWEHFVKSKNDEWPR